MVKNSKTNELAKSLLDAIGENDDKQEVTSFIDTGLPKLNKVLSGKSDGGIPVGRLIEMFAPPSSGKTFLATQFMIQAQKMGGIVGFFDHEKSFAVSLAENMGLNTELPYWIYKQPVTWEKSNFMMAKAAKTIRENKLIKDDAPILFVLDSVASCLTESTAGKEFDEMNMNDNTALARVTSATLKSMAHYANEYNFTVIYLNQTRTKLGVMFGDPTTTSGGQAMEFYTSIRLSLTREQLKEGKEMTGQRIKMKTVKNKVTKPFQNFEIDAYFDEFGRLMFDFVGSMIDTAKELGNLKTSGSYIEYDGKKLYKSQLVKHFNENPKELDKLKALATP